MHTVTEAQNRITLYYREGSSDKVYQAAIEPKDGLFVVNFAYGRRGSTLTTGTKTSSPVEYDTAKHIFDKIVREKKSKGYTEGENSTPYQHTDKQSSGILPQLLNPIEESDVERLLSDDEYCAQEKHDGRHILIRKQDERIEGINKKGLLVGLPETVMNDILTLPGSFIPDGESVGDDYHAFDLLELNGKDLRPFPYRTRLTYLVNLLLSGAKHDHVRLVETAFTTKQKTALWERLRRENREGIVFKRLDAPYVSGRPNSSGPQLKFKFVASLSVVVARVNAKRSVEVSLLKGRSLVSCGNVTIPANHNIPTVGDVVEVRYLYANRESNALYQPVYLGLRDDVELGQCLFSQLKYKADESERCGHQPLSLREVFYYTKPSKKSASGVLVAIAFHHTRPTKLNTHPKSFRNVTQCCQKSFLPHSIAFPKWACNDKNMKLATLPFKKNPPTV